jgi:HK97 family phage major capsid protein
MLSEKIKELRSQITQKQTAVNTKITEAQKRAEEDKLDEATALKGEISTLKEELDALKKKLAEYEEIAGMNPEEPTPADGKEEDDEEKRSMHGGFRTIIKPGKQEEVRAFEEFLR